MPSSLRARSSSDGTSSTQGGHQVAQKLSSTGWPCWLRSETVRPPASGSWKSGVAPFCRKAGSGSGLSAAQAPSRVRASVACTPPRNRTATNAIAAAVMTDGATRRTRDTPVGEAASPSRFFKAFPSSASVHRRRAPPAGDF